MQDPIKKLHQDHINLSKLLDVLSEQLVHLQTGTDIEYDLILCAMDYVTHFPELFHHPVEDELFKIYQHSHQDLDREIDRLEREHRDMKLLTSGLVEATERILQNQAINRDTYINLLDEFIQKQRDHMNLEEGKVFPVIGKALSNATELDMSLLEHIPEDPLFEAASKSKYDSLLKKLSC